MRILLAKCPRAYQSHFEENSESLALAYIAAMLRNNGSEVDVLDASLIGLSLDETLNNILGKEYDLIGFSIADPTFIESTFEAISVLRRNGVKSHITMGGHAPTFHYKEVLEMCPGLDSIVMYEGEKTALELASFLKQGKEWREIRGLAYRSDDDIKYNPPRPLISDLDSLLFPARDTLPHLLQDKKETGVVSMSGGRGCYMNCGFCSIKAFYTIPEGPSWRFRSNKNIINEIEYLIRTYGVKEILFVDDVFVGPSEKNRRRIFQLADEIEKRRLKVMISISERVDNIEENLFRRLREVGLRQILLGIESGSQEILDYFNKGIRLQQIRNAVEILQRLDIDVTVAFINFTPITTLEQLRENIDFFLSLKVNILQGLLNRFQIYGGTLLEEKLQMASLVKGKFPNFSYTTPDKRVDIVYQIVQRSLGTFLSVAYELKKLERALRIRLFEAEIQERLEETALRRRERRRYERLMNKIMEEATEVLRKIIAFADMEHAYDSQEVEKFTKEVTEISTFAYKNWLSLIQFFKNFCPALKPSVILNKQSPLDQRKEVDNVRMQDYS